MYPRSRIAAEIRSRSLSLTLSGRFSARETVAVDTPAKRATSRIPMDLVGFSIFSAIISVTYYRAKTIAQCKFLRKIVHYN